MSRQLSVVGFKWVEDASQFDKDLTTENYNEDSYKQYFLKADGKHPKTLHELHRDLSFLPERMKTKPTYTIKKTLYAHTKFKTRIGSWISKKIIES